jgi:RimJ/RimL family protein N-acetyltransferase
MTAVQTEALETTVAAAAIGAPAAHDALHGSIRKLLPSEAEAFAAHLLRLDREARRMRFAHSVSDTFIEDYASRMLDDGSVVFGYIEDGEVRAVAELKKIGDDWGNEAEAAFSVEKAMEGRGLGTDLMGRVIRAARNRGVTHLYMSCLAENTKMQAIARKHQAELKFEYGEVVGEIVPSSANYFSLLAEAVEDRVGYMLAVLDLSARLRTAA